MARDRLQAFCSNIVPHLKSDKQQEDEEYKMMKTSDLFKKLKKCWISDQIAVHKMDYKKAEKEFSKLFKEKKIDEVRKSSSKDQESLWKY